MRYKTQQFEKKKKVCAVSIHYNVAFIQEFVEGA